jgi:chemotaxis protein methyltransferase CheR
MQSGSVSLELPLNVFVILRDLIHERTGLFYDIPKRDLLAEKLGSRLVELGLETFLDLYYLLKYGPGADDEWPHVMDALSVQETYFWREMAQVQAFVNTLLPSRVAAFPGQTVRIWCAACATGEEPLSIAMALAEAGWWDRVPISLTASDGSRSAIARAKLGLYRERSFRNLPSPLREKYFSPQPGGWQVDENLIKRIAWAHANLADPGQVRTFVQVPFLFCRNVFIYFSEEMIGRTVSCFAEGMARPGYLFVGASESLLKVTDRFELRQAGDAFVYALN